MLISVGFCLVLAATYSLCHCSDALAPETVRFSSEYNYEHTDSVDKIRSKRSLFGIGKGVWAGYMAAKELLKDAWPIASNFANRKAFVKPGNYEKAVADFRSVNPTNVHPFELPGGCIPPLKRRSGSGLAESELEQAEEFYDHSIERSRW